MRGNARAALALVVIVGSALAAWRLSRWRDEARSPAAAPAARPDLGRRVRVEVLNAGGKEGVARDATELLRRDGFDVVYFGNADKFGQDSSVVLDRAGNVALARAVADALGIRNVRSEPDPNLYLDVSVMLGRDWLAPGAAGDGRKARHSGWAPWRRTAH